MADDISFNSGEMNLGSSKTRVSQQDSKKSAEAKVNPGAPFKSLGDLIKRFSQLQSAESPWRKDKKKWQRYYDGDQLSADEVSELNARNQPNIVINKIAPRIDLVVGMMAGNRYRLSAFPRNASEEDLGSAEAVNKGLRHIEEHNEQKYLESEVFEDGLITGRSWFEVTSSLNPDFDLDIIIKARDSDDIFIDPAAVRYDLSDAKDLADSFFVHKDDLISIYPDFEDEIKASFMEGPSSIHYDRKYAGDDYLMALLRDDKTKNAFIDKKNNRVRLTKYWFRQKELRKFVLTSKGVERLQRGISKKEEQRVLKDIQKATNEKPEVLELMTDVIRVQTFLPTAILENKEPEFLGDMFPYVNYIVKKDKASNLPYGLVRPMIDPQDEINKRRSKGLHLLNTERTIYEEGAVDDEEVLKREVARADGIIKRNRGYELKIESNREMGQSQLSLYQAANQELNDVTGVSPDLMGMVTNARSQAAIQQRQRQSLAVLNRAFENWKRTKILLEKLKLKFMQEFWTGPRVINVTDNEGSVQSFPLNVTYRDTKTGELKKLNDISVGKYDIVFEETPETVNYMEDVFVELAKLAQTGQVPPELPIEFAPLPKEIRDRLLNRLNEARQQQQAALQQQAMLQSQVEAQGAEGAGSAQPIPLG